jgi:hypothetical protein
MPDLPRRSRSGRQLIDTAPPPGGRKSTVSGALTPGGIGTPVDNDRRIAPATRSRPVLPGGLPYPARPRSPRPVTLGLRRPPGAGRLERPDRAVDSGGTIKGAGESSTYGPHMAGRSVRQLRVR